MGYGKITQHGQREHRKIFKNSAFTFQNHYLVHIYDRIKDLLFFQK